MARASRGQEIGKFMELWILAIDDRTCHDNMGFGKGVFGKTCSRIMEFGCHYT